jgi:hypothetical protein
MADHFRRLLATLAGPLAVALALMGLAGTAAAEHEADHRYDVRGYVLDPDKRPIAATHVVVRQGDKVIGGGRTDRNGFYSIELHLHDADIGDTFAVRTGEHQALIRMQAAHGDRTTARVHHVNFLGGEVVEKDLSWLNVPAWAYVVAAPLALWAALYVGGVIRRKMRKPRLADAPQEPGREKRRRGKRRR